MPERRLPNAMQVRTEPVVDLPVIEPGAALLVHPDGPRLKAEHVPPVLEGMYVLVESPPLVRDDRHPALGRELLRDPLPLEAPGVRVPRHGLLLLGLAETLQQPHAGA